MTTKLEVGAVYDIDHSRKGKFKGKLIRDDGEFVTVVIVGDTVAAGMNEDWVDGEELDIRRSIATFTKSR